MPKAVREGNGMMAAESSLHSKILSASNDERGKKGVNE